MVSNKKFYGKLGAAALLAALFLSVFAVLVPQDALAHGRRDLAGGKYEVVFGFLAEPAFTNEQNGISLRVCEGKCKSENGVDINPVKEVNKTLKAQAIQGTQAIDVELKPRFRVDGSYDAYFIPTKAGEYTFRFYGTINGDQIDERVVSGKDGYNSVEDAKQLPAVEAGTANLATQVKEAKDSASLATIFGIVGTVVGLLGLAIGAMSLARRPKATTSSGEVRQPVGSGSGRGPQGG